MLRDPEPELVPPMPSQGRSPLEIQRCDQAREAGKRHFVCCAPDGTARGANSCANCALRMLAVAKERWPLPQDIVRLKVAAWSQGQGGGASAMRCVRNRPHADRTRMLRSGSAKGLTGEWGCGPMAPVAPAAVDLLRCARVRFADMHREPWGTFNECG